MDSWSRESRVESRIRVQMRTNEQVNKNDERQGVGGGGGVFLSRLVLSCLAVIIILG